MKNLSQKIINRIKQEGIEPTPKWEFVLKNSFFWGAFGLAVIIGALSFSIIFHTLLNNDWDLHMQLSGGLTKFIIITLPYFWLILLTLFIVIAYINIRNTKKAYKYSLSMIIGGVILASFLLGITFYNLGLASSIDRNLIQIIVDVDEEMFDEYAIVTSPIVMMCADGLDNRKKIMVLGLLSGILMGVLASLLVEYMDTSIKNVEDVGSHIT